MSEQTQDDGRQMEGVTGAPLGPRDDDRSEAEQAAHGGGIDLGDAVSDVAAGNDEPQPQRDDDPMG